MKYRLCLIAVFYSVCIAAQPTVQWQKTFGGSEFDELSSIRQTIDGGYIAIGSTLSGNGDITEHYGGDDCWIIKLSSSGTMQWNKVVGGTGNDITRSICQTVDGGYFVSGYSESNDYDVSSNHGGIFDGWIVKLDSTGNIQWQKALGGSGWDDIWSAKQTSDNGYILTGRSNSTDGDLTENLGQLDIWIVKLDEEGSLQWQNVFGGSGDDVSKSVKQTSDGGYIIAGETASTDGDVTHLNGNVDYWIIKLSSDGQLEWQKTLGGNYADIASDIIQANDNGYIVIGYSSSNDGDVTGNHGMLDYWVVKLSEQGELIWQKAFGGSNLDYARNIVSTVDGYLIMGTTQSSNGDVIGNDGGADYWVIKISNTGELLWQKSYGGSMAELGASVDYTSDKGLIIGGYAWSSNGDLAGLENQGKDDFWIVKLSPETVGTNDLQSNTENLEIYPNPSQQSIYLKLPSEESEVDVTISDMLGRKVLQQKSFNVQSLNISSLATGLYILTASTSDGKVFQGRFEKN